jgi:hypothetical protein
MYGAITGHVAVGRYVLEIGDPCGALVRDASRTARPHPRPRATPLLLRPKSIRGLLDRRELDAALSAIDSGLPLEVTGEPGVGKTALLRQLAHHPRAASFPDGIVYLSAQHLAPLDLAQLLVEAFFESDEVCQRTDSEVRRLLHDKRALILLDDVRMGQEDLDQVFDIAPRCAFIAATRTRSLWGEGRSITLKGLPQPDALSLLERALERPLASAEQSDAELLCAALEGHPLRLVQAAALSRERGLALDGWARDLRPESLLTALVSSTDEKQRRVLLALTALPGASLPTQEIAGLAEITDAEPSLLALVRLGLVTRSHARHQLVDGVADRLRRTDDLKPWVNRAITYFTAWAERQRRSPLPLLEESEALLRVQQLAAETRRFGEVFRLGRVLEGALVIGARWGAWGVVLERCLAAAKATGDRSAEAWALHQLGTRALCLGETRVARTMLGQAVKLREALPGDSAAAGSRGNLAFVALPVARPSREDSPVIADEAFDLDAMPLRDPLPAIRASGTTTASYGLLIALLSALVGWLAYLAVDRGPGSLPFQRRPAGPAAAGRSSPDQAVQTGGSRAVLETAAEIPPLAAAAPTTGVAPRAGAAPDNSSILIFTARPGSIATSRSTELCYAVSGARLARIEPGVGDVDPTSTLTCRRVAPRRTTTYQLTAIGRDGQHATQRLVVVVR